MTLTPTAGRWWASAPQHCGCSWPIHWRSEITSLDRDNRTLAHVATVIQTGGTCNEARANLLAMSRATAMVEQLRMIAQAIALSDPDEVRPPGRDAVALRALHDQAPAIWRLLDEIDGKIDPPAPRRELPRAVSCRGC